MNESDFDLIDTAVDKEKLDACNLYPEHSVNSTGLTKRISICKPLSPSFPSVVSPIESMLSPIKSDSVISPYDDCYFGRVTPLNSSLAPLSPLHSISLVESFDGPQIGSPVISSSRVQVRRVGIDIVPQFGKQTLLNLSELNKDIGSRGSTSELTPVSNISEEFPSFPNISWFLSDSVHLIEMESFPSLSKPYLNNNTLSSPEKYIELRNIMIMEYHKSPSKRLEMFPLLQKFVGPSLEYLQLYSFLEHWGFINSACLFSNQIFVQSAQGKDQSSPSLLFNDLRSLHDVVLNVDGGDQLEDECQNCCYSCHSMFTKRRYQYFSCGLSFNFCHICFVKGCFPEEFSSGRFRVFELPPALDKLDNRYIEDKILAGGIERDAIFSSCKDYLLGTQTSRLSFDDMFFSISSTPFSMLFSYLDEFFPEIAPKVIGMAKDACWKEFPLLELNDVGVIDELLAKEEIFRETMKSHIVEVISLEAMVILLRGKQLN
jgi:hypothetical protein